MSAGIDAPARIPDTARSHPPPAAGSAIDMADDSAHSADHPVPDPIAATIGDGTAARNRLVIGLLLIAAFVVILNETIMSVAIPRFMLAFNAPASAAQWLTTAFLLTTAVVIPVTGFILQRVNTRPVFICAMTLFSLGTLAAALAPDLAVLVIARTVQAGGSAIMIPLLMTTVMTLVPEESRGKTMGDITIVISVAPAVGPTLSGIILSYLSWRWMFLLVLPIALGALLLGARRIHNVTTPRHVPLDALSVVLSALGFGGIVYGLSGIGGAAAPGALPPWMVLAGGAAGLLCFSLRQLSLQRHDRALLDLRTFGSRNFAAAVLLMAIMMMALFGTIILLPIYLQNVLGLGILQTGLLLLPGGLLMGLLSPPVGRLYDRIGPGRLLVPGVILVSAVLWAMTLLGRRTPVEYILAGHVVMSVGFALLFTPLFTASLSSVRPELYAHGSAVLGATQQVAGAAGVALFVALMSARAAQLAAHGAAALDALAGGIRNGFLCGAILSLFAVLCACFVRRPAPAAAAAPSPAPASLPSPS
ncbi:MAG TPA: DHA2 family efflux MFS transporter permease subunit [Steroidobacteraceae bacterium]|nr:DHA2 family efflux MFS transporter permease subunit [Steroidobacteraceae bacterium]